MDAINKSQENEGKKLSFYQLFNKENLNIEIPIIQRDYAQGRETATNIRDQFVGALFNALETQKPLHLDFVYGNVIDKKFTPLDGQQRLTTLFLLHWYLSIKENQFNHFQGYIKIGDISKFTYETRMSSREFCHELVNHPITNLEGNDSYSSIIRNKNWYFSTWEKDPTINSMLIMIDTIDDIYQSLDKKGKFYKQLIDQNDPTITFQFIELKDFGLSDSLYIKMNARGKPLTDFENFKAKFEQLLIDYDIEKNKKYSDLFKNKIDNNWSDVFWTFRGNNSQLFDQEFMNYVKVVLTSSLASSSEGKSNTISYMVRSQNNLSFYELNKFDAFNNNGIEDLISFLSYIENNNEFARHLKDNYTVNEEQLFFDVTNYDLTYIKRIQFYALYKFIQFNESKDEIDEWMRVIRNLSANSVYRQAETFEIAIKSIDQMLPFSTNILDYFRKGNKPKGFLGFQLDEEEIKSFLIERSTEWEQEIKKIENHGYFNGQIEFALDFCGVTAYFKDNHNVNWPEKDNKVIFNNFIFYTKTANLLFDDKGLREFPDFIFERALLSFGNYTLTKGRNRSFLVNNDREIGWKRLLRDSENDKRHLIKKLFDKLNHNSPIENQLKDIIKNNDDNSWRRYFINYPETIEVCGKEKLFRVGPNYGYQDLLLLERKQTNGKHREYFSYGLCCQLKEMGHVVDYETANSVDEWKFITSINKKSVYIKFWELDSIDSLGFIVETGELYFEATNENDVLDFLSENNFI